jgi:Tfp pilus assembly PilM family ATPase
MTTILDKFSKIFIGMEFRDESLTISCIKNDLSGMKHLSSSTFPLRKDDETITEIKSFLTENVRGPKEVFVTVPYSWAIVKFVNVPSPKAKGKDALAHMMRFEIERHIPYPIDDVFCDFQVVDRSESAFHLLSVAVHKNKINDVQELLERLSLRTETITLSPLAILNAVELSDTEVASWQNLIGFTKKSDLLGKKGERVASLFIDDSTAHFSLLSGGKCMYLNSFRIDQNLPVEKTADDIASEISSALQERTIEKIDKLLLSGTLTTMKDLSSAVGDKTGSPVHLVNPVEKFLKGTINAQGLQLTSSIGSCYSGLEIGTLKINLLQHKSDTLFRKTGALITKISIPLILLMIIGIFAIDAVNERRLLAMIDEKLNANEPDIKAIEKLTSEISILKQKKKFLMDVKESNIILDILSELTGIIPVDTWVSSFNFKTKSGNKGKTLQGEITISGFAQSSSVLISLLEDSPFFEKVEFVGPIKKRRGIEEFKINIVTITPETPNVEKKENELSEITERNK